MTYFLVYKITNKLTGKYYIGSHITQNKNDSYFGSGRMLKCAVKRHGLKSFIKEILFEAPNARVMYDKERELVVLGPQSYNIKPGGLGGSVKGRYLSAETRLKMSTCKPGRHHTPETIAKISASRRGQRITEETKKKLSASLLLYHKSHIPFKNEHIKIL